uniref:Uncharacterized protein n=1 Tax=Malurus cyaneus samueli TaxID=2593467 RepID=A0A8C5TBG7_9PASS
PEQRSITISEGSCPERITTIQPAHRRCLPQHHPAGPAMSSGGSEGKQGVCEVPCQGSGEAGNTIISFASCEHGAQVQVAGDLLPNSTERAVTCVRQICAVILEDCQGPPSPGGICYPLPPQGFPCPSGPKHQGPPVWKPIGAPCLSGAGGYAQLSAVLLWASLLTPSLSFQLIGCIIGRHGSKISEIGRCQAPTSRLATRPRVSAWAGYMLGASEGGIYPVPKAAFEDTPTRLHKSNEEDELGVFEILR